jgi:hypothetical protein
MPDSPRSTDSPRLTQAKSAERGAREARLAEALRDNLRRRKQQARDRAAGHDMAGHETQDTKAKPSGRWKGNTGPTG